jgi:hypothetical protein
VSFARPACFLVGDTALAPTDVEQVEPGSPSYGTNHIFPRVKLFEWRVIQYRAAD